MAAAQIGTVSRRKNLGAAVFLAVWLAQGASGLAEEAPLLGTDVKLGRCEASATFVLAIHGGTVRQRHDFPGRTALMERVLVEGRAALSDGAKALDVVHAAVRAMEDSGLFNAGRGSFANQAAVVELDASIMDGKRQNAGAVAAVKRIKNPITAARLVMQRSPQVMLVGPDAEAYAAKHKHVPVDPAYFRLNGLDFSEIPLPEDVEVVPPTADLPPEAAGFSGVWGGVFLGAINALLIVEQVTPEGARVVFGHGLSEGMGIDRSAAARYEAEISRGALKFATDGPRPGKISLRINSADALEAVYSAKGLKRATARLKRLGEIPEPGDHGTVGAVALDRCSDLAAGTSTGGFGSKVPGRIGDSPIIGAGTYADNATAAVSAAGHGEFFMRYVVAYDIAARMAYGGHDLATAVEQAIGGRLTKAGGRGGVIAVDRAGNMVSAFNRPGMLRGVAGSDHDLSVKID